MLRTDSPFSKSAARLLWFAAIAAGTLYWLGSLGRSGVAFHELAAWPKLFVVALKATATGLLVLASWAVARRNDTWLVTAALAIIWLADIVLALGYAVPSGFIFVLAHAVAIFAYLRCLSREKLRAGMIAVAAAMPTIGMAIHVYVTGALNLSPLFTVFPLFSLLVAMVATLSRFPFWPLAAGTILFPVSDIVGIYSLYAHEGHSIAWLTWFSYFGGLALIVLGLIAAPDPEK